MTLLYKGNFNGDTETLPHREHMPGAVKFREASNFKAFALIMNLVSIVVLLLLSGFCFWRTGEIDFNLWGIITSVLLLFPHEFLHALCFKEEVNLYCSPKLGMLFIVGNETMSKGRFILMSMLPNLVFGFIPFLIYLINPDITFLGSLGVFAISMGVGDYYNTINAITQMPKGARTYLYKSNSYWYMPEENDNTIPDNKQSDITV